MPSQSNDDSHQHKVKQTQRHKILPLELQYLVDTKTRIRPLDPKQYPYKEESLGQEPYNAGDVIHYSIESVKSCYMQRHPSSEEHC